MKSMMCWIARRGWKWVIIRDTFPYQDKEEARRQLPFSFWRRATAERVANEINNAFVDGGDYTANTGKVYGR